LELLRRKIEIMPNEFVTYKFEWDDNKSSNNHNKHGITFEEAVNLFVEQFEGTIQSAGKVVLEEEREQIDQRDKNGKKWRMIFVVRERQDNGYPEHVIRIISFCRKD